MDTPVPARRDNHSPPLLLLLLLLRLLRISIVAEGALAPVSALPPISAVAYVTPSSSALVSGVAALGIPAHEAARLHHEVICQRVSLVHLFLRSCEFQDALPSFSSVRVRLMNLDGSPGLLPDGTHLGPALADDVANLVIRDAELHDDTWSLRMTLRPVAPAGATPVTTSISRRLLTLMALMTHVATPPASGKL